MSLKILLTIACFVSIASSFCGQWDNQAVGNYILYNNLWGMSGATGSQCTTLVSQSGTTVAWKTVWSWSGGSGVKSFANLALTTGLNTMLSSISSIPSSWQWDYGNTGSIVGDVAYDIWTSNKIGASNQYEIMIWLAKYGNAAPVSSHYNSSGQPVPIASPTIDGASYKLYAGTVSTWTVYSFVSDRTITSFSGDLKSFFTFLINDGSISSSQYLTGLQAGTEPTSGTSATLTVTKYSTVVN
jgi:xyloglucan-specific endo-beta-1,4-glucanase